MNTLIRCQPQNLMRDKNAVGDYWEENHILHIRVARMPDWRYEFLIAVHEFIEEALTRHRGILEPTILAFDLKYPFMQDPGMCPEAPYHREHITATAIEMLLAQELQVDWTDYETALEISKD